jgi:hypothetical protein
MGSGFFEERPKYDHFNSRANCNTASRISPIGKKHPIKFAPKSKDVDCIKAAHGKRQYFLARLVSHSGLVGQIMLRPHAGMGSGILVNKG